MRKHPTYNVRHFALQNRRSPQLTKVFDKTIKHRSARKHYRQYWGVAQTVADMGLNSLNRFAPCQRRDETADQDDYSAKR